MCLRHLCWLIKLFLFLLLWATLCSDAQLCLTLCGPMRCGLSVSSVHEILLARILEWVAVSYSRGSSCLRAWTHVSCSASRFFYHCTTWEASQLLLGNYYVPSPQKTRSKDFWRSLQSGRLPNTLTIIIPCDKHRAMGVEKQAGRHLRRYGAELPKVHRSWSGKGGKREWWRAFQKEGPA